MYDPIVVTRWGSRVSHSKDSVIYSCSTKATCDGTNSVILENRLWGINVYGVRLLVNSGLHLCLSRIIASDWSIGNPDIRSWLSFCQPVRLLLGNTCWQRTVPRSKWINSSGYNGVLLKVIKDPISVTSFASIIPVSLRACCHLLHWVKFDCFTISYWHSRLYSTSSSKCVTIAAFTLVLNRANVSPIIPIPSCWIGSI